MKDFSTISPSARFLIHLKANTNIPFAKEAVAILNAGSPQAEMPEPTEEQRRYYYRQLIHFENRYVTVDRLLQTVSAKNYLEISSGFSFRGLAMCNQDDVHFIDTDLPGVTETKEALTEELIASQHLSPKGKLEMLPLNVLDETAFQEIVNRFASGPLVIMNEGLLVYLNREEKCRLRDIVAGVLRKRGGYWITADIYIKSEGEERTFPNEQAAKFYRDHQIHENRFESYADAEQFFVDGGFRITAVEDDAFEELSAIQRAGDKRQAILEKLKNTPRNRQSWCLEVAVNSL